MKIAILHREYPPNTVFVSTSSLYQDLARALAARGHEVHVICQADGKPVRRVDDGVIVHEVGTRTERGSLSARVNYLVHAWRKLRELLRHNHVEVVNAELFLGEGFLYALQKGCVPLVIQVHAWAMGWLEAPSAREAAQRRLASLVETITVKRADRIIATSRSTFRRLTEDLGAEASKVVVIHEPIDMSRYRPVQSDFRRRHDLPIDANVVLFASTLEHRKGPDVFARAAPLVLRQIPDVLFVMAGRDTVSAARGSMMARVRAIAETEGCANRLVFLGPLSPDEMVSAYSACDVFVYPGLLEAGGKPPVEAMACNRPVVATDTGISSELKGLSPAISIVPPNDPVRLAGAIVHLLTLPRGERDRLASSHRKIVEERFSASRVVDETLAVYEDAIAERAIFRSTEDRVVE